MQTPRSLPGPDESDSLEMGHKNLHFHISPAGFFFINLISGYINTEKRISHK